jgi:hypothetical protein
MFFESTGFNISAKKIYLSDPTIAVDGEANPDVGKKIDCESWRSI